jgi:hypothetical protein
MSLFEILLLFIGSEKLPTSIKFGLLIAAIVWHGLILLYVFYLSPTWGKLWPNRNESDNQYRY